MSRNREIPQMVWMIVFVDSMWFSHNKYLRVLLIVIQLMLVAWLHGNSLPLSPRSNALGNADSLGYVRIVEKLGDLNLDGSRQWPVTLVFTSNPNADPGLFGPGWHFPLFDSKVIQYSRNNLMWEAPDEGRYFFSKDREGNNHQVDVYFHLGEKWKALVRKNGDILITGTTTSDWAFEYRSGRLQRFRMGEDSDSFKIHYNSRGFPMRVTAESTRSVVFDMEYRGATPIRMKVGEKLIDVELGEGEMLSPDGRTDYAHHRMAFLNALVVDQEERIEFLYQRAGAHKREVNIPKTDKTGSDKKQVRPPLNSMIIKSSVSGNESLVKWEAVTGFVVADSEGRYVVENNDYDSYAKNHEIASLLRVRMAPDKVFLKRTAEDNEEHVWGYDRRSGIETTSVPGRKSIIRKTYITAKGPAYMKLRKEEEQTEDGWKMLRYHSYDSLGRIVRSIQGDRVTVWGRDNGVERQQRFDSGKLSLSSIYREGKLAERTRYRENGDEETYYFTYVDSMRHVTHLINNNLQWKKKYYPDNRIAEMIWPNGYSEIYQYQDEGMKLYRLFANGDVEVFLRKTGDPRYYQIYNY